MGDRAQVLIEDTGVYLYTHWGGSNLLETVKEAIGSKEGRGRWSDGEYLTRIIFSRMIKHDLMGETGYGIGTRQHGDIERLITVNCKEKTIRYQELYGPNNIDTKIKFEDC
jgi:hypothetical protein